MHHRQTTLNFRNFLQIQISLSFFSSFLKLEKKLIQHDYQHDSFRQNYQINLIVFRVGCTPLKKGVEKEVVWHSLRVSNLFGFLDRHRITVEIDVKDSLQTCPIQEEKDQFPSEIPAFPPSFPSSRFTISHRGIDVNYKRIPWLGERGRRDAVATAFSVETWKRRFTREDYIYIPMMTQIVPRVICSFPEERTLGTKTASRSFGGDDGAIYFGRRKERVLERVERSRLTKMNYIIKRVNLIKRKL